MAQDTRKRNHPAVARPGPGLLALALLTGCALPGPGGTAEPAVPSSAPPTTAATPTTEPTRTVPGPASPAMPGALPDQDFTYDEAYAAWQDGMPYYDAFCIHYEPTTPGGESQCEGIENGTVDSVTGESIGG